MKIKNGNHHSTLAPGQQTIYLFIYLFTTKVRVTSHKSELCSHFETCFRHSATDSKVIAAVVAEPFLFSTAHSYVEITITVCASFAKGFFFLNSLNSQPALFPSTGFPGKTLVTCQHGRVKLMI